MKTTIAILGFSFGLAAAPPPVVAPRYVQVPVRAQADRPAAKVFQAKLDRKIARIAKVLSPGDPLMLLLVLDLVGDLGTIEPAKEALVAAVEKLPPTTSVGLLRAQDGLTVLADPSSDRAPVIAAIRDMNISGRPGLLETLEPVERIADSIARKSQVRVAVLYITDSNVTEYREDFTNPVINSSDPHDLSRRFPETLIQEKMSKLQTIFGAHQTPVYVVHLTYRSDRLNEAYQNGLRQLSEALVGTSEFCRSRSEVPEAIEKAVGEIEAGYSLVIALPEHAPSSLQVQVTAGDTPLLYRTRLELKEK